MSEFIQDVQETIKLLQTHSNVSTTQMPVVLASIIGVLVGLQNLHTEEELKVIMVECMIEAFRKAKNFNPNSSGEQQ